MMLPLHHYDEAGIIKPPLWLYAMTLLASGDWLLVLFALAIPDQTQTLLGLVYPSREFLFIKLAASLPFLTVLMLISQRQRLWKKQHYRWRWMVIPLLLLGNALAILMLANHLVDTRWQFHWLQAGALSLQLVFFTLLVRSQHLRLMIADWSGKNLSR